MTVEVRDVYLCDLKNISSNVSLDVEHIAGLLSDCKGLSDGQEPADSLAEDSLEQGLPLSYRIFATVLHSIIFFLGLTGNSLLIITASTAPTLKIPTYSYLVSLAVADLIVTCTAIPDAIVSHHIGARWLWGSAGCATFVFFNFLGINAGSLSILTFTLERYIAICHPMLAYRICTTERTNSIILAVWIVAILYCCPWLALTEVKGDPYDPYVEYCTFRLSKHQYTIFFICDLVVFYIVPLCVAFAVYARIAAKMAQPRKNTLRTSLDSSSVCYDAATTSVRMKRRSACVSEGVSMPQAKCRSSAVAMLVVVVVVFAMTWFPFRALLVYNSFVQEPWFNIWYVLFAKTMIYANCAVNPILYNIASKKYQAAVIRTLNTICGVKW